MRPWDWAVGLALAVGFGPSHVGRALWASDTGGRRSWWTYPVRRRRPRTLRSGGDLCIRRTPRPPGGLPCRTQPGPHSLQRATASATWRSGSDGRRGTGRSPGNRPARPSSDSHDGTGDLVGAGRPGHRSVGLGRCRDRPGPLDGQGTSVVARRIHIPLEALEREQPLEDRAERRRKGQGRVAHPGGAGERDPVTSTRSVITDEWVIPPEHRASGAHPCPTTARRSSVGLQLRRRRGTPRMRRTRIRALLHMLPGRIHALGSSPSNAVSTRENTARRLLAAGGGIFACPRGAGPRARPWGQDLVLRATVPGRIGHAHRLRPLGGR